MGFLYYPAKEIIKNLWIGSEGDAGSSSFMRKHAIRLVVDVSKSIPMHFRSSIPSVRIPVDDDPDENEQIIKYWPTVVRAIDEVLKANQGVLVHCRAGMQRSAATVAAYLIWKRKMSAAEAIGYIRGIKPETFMAYPPGNKRWHRLASPNVTYNGLVLNPTFAPALEEWEARVKRSNSAS